MKNYNRIESKEILITFGEKARQLYDETEPFYVFYDPEEQTYAIHMAELGRTPEVWLTKEQAQAEFDDLYNVFYLEG